MSKRISPAQMRELADRYGIAYAAVRAIIDVEASGQGFINDDTLPKILYEPHVMYKLLTQRGKVSIRNDLMKAHPRLCYPRWGTHRYGPVSEQHIRLGHAASFDRDCALESCSWGMGQVMGYHWKSLGYESLQAFINAMYKDEASQVDAMLRFIKVNGLLVHLKTRNWAAFAKGYNGAGYIKNQYHTKLAKAYAKYA